MVKIRCCLCSRRTDTKKQRTRVYASVYGLISLHAKNEGLDISHISMDEDYICTKCYANVAHYRMKGRPPPKKKMKLSELEVPQPIRNETSSDNNEQNVSSPLDDSQNIVITIQQRASPLIEAIGMFLFVM